MNVTNMLKMSSSGVIIFS